MLERAVVRVRLVAAALVLGVLAPGCSVTTQAPAVLLPFRAAVAPLATIAGRAVAPAGVISSNGGAAIANNGAAVISNHGADWVPNSRGTFSSMTGPRRLLSADDWVPVPGAVARLMDGAGQDLVGVAAVTTDANGAFTFHNVPAEHAFFVSIDRSGVHLAILIKPEAATARIEIDPATTLVAEHLRKTLAGRPASLDAFKSAAIVNLTEALRANVSKQVDISSAEAASNGFERAATTNDKLATEDHTAVAQAQSDAASLAQTPVTPATSDSLRSEDGLRPSTEPRLADEPQHSASPDEPAHSASPDEPQHPSASKPPAHSSTPDDAPRASSSGDPVRATASDVPHSPGATFRPDGGRQSDSPEHVTSSASPFHGKPAESPDAPDRPRSARP
jgi:hypothetical protein